MMINTEILEQAIAQIQKSPEHYSYFFNKLQKPDWIKPLLERGFFKEPPSVNREGEYLSVPFWPESQYLSRMAKKDPENTYHALLGIPPTDNPRVHEDILEAVAKLPSSFAHQLAKKELVWIKAQKSLYFSLPETLAQLISVFCDQGLDNFAVQISRELLTLKSGENGELGPKINVYQYEKLLTEQIPGLIIAAKFKALSMLAELLLQIVMNEGNQEEMRDFSWIWRRAIEDHRQNGSYKDIPDLVVESTRDAAVSLIQNGLASAEEVLDFFKQYNWPIFKRISLHIIRVAVDDNTIIAENVLNRESFDSIDIRHEYFLLLRDCFGKLNPNQQAEFLQWIENGPDQQTFVDGFNLATAKAPTDAECEKYVLSWQRDWLSAIEAYLQGTWKDKLTFLREQCGNELHPEFPSYIETGWVGPTSPMNEETLKHMDISDLVKFLKDWQGDRTFRGATPEGLGRVLTYIIENSPQPYAEHADQFIDLKPTYVRNILWGFNQAIKQNRNFDWEKVLLLMQWVVEQEVIKTSDEQRQYMLDEDPDWTWTRRNVGMLVAQSLESDPPVLTLEQRAPIWAILDLLLKDEEPTIEQERESSMDPVTLSINTVRGIALNSVVYYSLWIQNQLKLQGISEDQMFTLMPEVSAALTDSIRAENTLAVRSVYGRWLPQFIALDKSWFVNHYHDFFPSDPTKSIWASVVWETYLTFWQVSTDIFDLLENQYINSVDGLNSENTSPTKIEQNLAEHIIILYALNKLKLDEGILPRFYAKASNALIDHALEHIGRGLLHHDGKLDGDVSERLRRLWEWHKEHFNEPQKKEVLSPFGWWFIAKKFDRLWELNELNYVLRSGVLPQPLYQVAEVLVEDIHNNPTLTLEALNLISQNVKHTWEMHSIINFATDILKYGIENPEDEIKDAAREIINRFGSMGFHQFRRLLG
jgi:hypothetical protein